MTEITAVAGQIVSREQLGALMTRTEQALAELNAKHGSVVINTATKEGYEDAKTRWREVYDVRLDFQKVADATLEDMYGQYKTARDSAKAIKLNLSTLEGRFKTEIDAEDDRKKAEREAKKQAEQNRIKEALNRIDTFRQIPVRYIAATVATLVAAIDELRVTELLEEEFKEFHPEAVEVLNSTISQLETMLEAKKQAEAIAEQQRAEKAELDRQRAEQEAKLAAERAAFAAEQAKAAAEREAAERAERERVAAEQRKRDEEAAAQRAALAAQQAEIDRQRAEIAAEQARAEALEKERVAAEWRKLEEEKAEIERAEAAEKAKREADEYQGWLAGMSVTEALEEILSRTKDSTTADICRFQLSDQIKRVSVKRDEYEKMQADSNTLSALFAAGVDGWDGYDTAMESMDSDD